MMDNTFDLKSLKAEVERYTLKKCNLYHEKIAHDSISGKPVQKRIGEEKYFERVGFCPLAVREKRLGCAHSAINARFGHLLKSLQLYDSEFLLLWEKFDRTINRIYALGHQKGDLEKELVGNPVKGTAQKIKKIKSEHSKLIDEIMTIRNETLERINGLLTKKDTTQVF
jgi:hypothetical protein